jgi:hypothetical protein
VHLDELLPAGDKLLERKLFRAGDRSHFWADRIAELSENPRVDRVGLGQLAGCPREVSNLPWIHNDDRQPGRRKCGYDWTLEPTGGLEDDAPDGMGFEGLQERLVAGAVVVKSLRLRAGSDGDIEPLFRDIYSHVDVTIHG